MPSIYVKALRDKKIAAFILLPLIEFEFAFNGAQKPVITQSERNTPQLKVLYRICKKHQWLSTNISKLGKKNEYYFKISNEGFSEIYKFAGPLADKNKDMWARLLTERTKASDNKDRNMSSKLLKTLKINREFTTKELCLRHRRLPYTITRHLRKFEKQNLIKKTKKGWIIISADVSANSPT